MGAEDEKSTSPGLGEMAPFLFSMSHLPFPGLRASPTDESNRIRYGTVCAALEFLYNTLTYEGENTLLEYECLVRREGKG